MKKNFKARISILLLLLCIIYSLTINNKITQASDVTLDANNINLVLDLLNYNNMPKNFRKSSNLINIKINKNLNISGLDTLNISGSQQFSQYNLPLVINSIETSLPITIIDLRQESHGFINGYPVSFANAKNDANIGLTKEQILLDENSKLANIKLNAPITFYNHSNITMVPIKVDNENQLVNSKSLSYIRIPVTDGKIPSDDMVDDIIKRQLLLANFNENDIKSFYNDERVIFLENFYKYSKEASNNFNIKWSDWKKTLHTDSSNFFPVTSICKTQLII